MKKLRIILIVLQFLYLSYCKFLYFDLFLESQLYSAGVEISPTTVKSTSSTLRIYATIENDIPSGGYIRIQFPSYVTSYPLTNCVLKTPTATITVTCSFSTTSSVVYLKATVSAKVSSYFDLYIYGFTNPSTTAITSTFQVHTYNSGGTQLDYQEEDMTLEATADTLTSLSMSSSSNIVGATGVDYTFTMKIKNSLSSTGFIRVVFPYWNPESSSKSSYLTSTSPTCTGITNVKTSPTGCSFSSQTLTITGAFSSTIAASSTVSFKVSTFRNPLVPTAVSGFEVYTGDSSDGGYIDYSTTTLTTSYPAQITTFSASLNYTIVQEYAQYKLTFLIPVPLSSGCIINITFPSYITLDQSLISEAYSFGIPGNKGQKDVSIYVDSSNSVIVTDACTTYYEYISSSSLYFANITNPDYVITSDLQIQITDSSQNTICSTQDSHPQVTTEVGEVKSFTVTADSDEISEITTLTVQYQPVHSLPAECKMVVQLPDDFTLSSSSTVSSVSLIQSSASITVSTSDNTITITDVFSSDYTYSDNQYISFTLSNVQMPDSARDTGTFQLTTYYYVSSGSYYEVDQVIQDNVLQSSEGILDSVLVTPSSYAATAITTYDFEIVTTHPILKGGYIKIKLPSEITLGTSSCTFSDVQNLESTVSCSFDSDDQTITINDGFVLSQQTATSETILFSVYGLQNPRSKQTSSNFEVCTYDSVDGVIDCSYTGTEVTMTSTNAISSYSVTPYGRIAGKNTKYTFAFKSPTALINGDLIRIDFPAEIGGPVSSTLSSCTGILKMTSSLTCSASGQYAIFVTASFYGSKISANTQFSFSVSYVTNPISTEKTSSFTATIYDSDYYEVNQMDTSVTTFKVQMYSGAEFPNISVSHQSSRALQTTTFTFNIELDYTLPAYSQIMIEYPTQIELNSTYFGCAVSNIDTKPTCTYDTKDRQIYLKDITTLDIEAGTYYWIMIHGLNNSMYAAATDSFKIYVMNQNGYEINYKETDLTITNDCDYPCLSCLSNATSKCTTCDITSQYWVLLNGQCLEKCPTNYYTSNYQCYQCQSDCMECAVGGQQCTKCYPGTYLQGGRCVSNCTEGLYIQNSKTYNCDQCSSPCATCENKTSQCTSCLSTIQNKMLWQSSCVVSCPPLVSVQVDGGCQACNSNCKTCSGLPTVCLSCNSTLKLDQLDMTCKDSCPVGTTVDMGDKCAPCDSSCKTCATTNASYCLSCQFGLNFYETQHQCVSTCPTGTVKVNQSSGSYCKECNTGCLQCQNSTSYCTKCDSNNLFYNFTCVNSCPSGYTRLSSSRNICVKEREDCPYGYEYNDYAQCELVIQKCREGYILNRLKDRCIPVPGAYVPVIFILCSLGWTLFIVIKYRKKVNAFTIITQLLVFYTAIQTFTYILMFSLSFALDYMMITAVHFISLCSMLLANAGFGLLFHLYLRKQDTAFKHWVDSYKKPYKIVFYSMIFWNFKLSRIYYSNLFGKIYFNAAFDNKYEAIIKPLFITTVVNFILQVMPIILMDIYNLIFIGWGYQIEVTSIDNMILAVVIFILEIIEFRYYKKLAVEEGSVYKVGSQQFLKVQQADNVMSGIMDDSSMIQFNKVKDYSDLMGTEELQYNEFTKKSKNKAPKSSEAQLLEKLVQKLKEEKKFNDIHEEEDEQHQTLAELEINNLSKLKDRNSLTQRERRQLIEATREKFENSISFRNVHVTQGSIIQNKVLNELHKAVFGEQTLIENLHRSQQIQTQKQENPDSARTEKFNHNYDNQNLIQVNSKTKAVTTRVETPQQDLGNQEQFERDRKEYAKFFNEFQEILENKQKSRQIRQRDWHSFDENVLREWYDDLGPESDFDSELSHESFEVPPKKLQNAEYLARLELFRENIKAKYQFNNVYTQMDHLPKKQLEQNKNVTRRTQTYEKDRAIGYDPFDQHEDWLQLEDEKFLELDPSFPRELILKVIQGQSDDYSVDKYDGESSDDSNFDFSQSKKRKRNIQFDIDDIMGMFDIDDFGNIILNKETMRDNLNRKVNTHGYLIDNKRNILNQDGQIIFEVEELDSDEDLPAAYRFEKRKKQLLKNDDKYLLDQEIQTQKNYDLESLLQNEEEKIELEFQKLKNASRPSSVDSLIGNIPINIDKDVNSHGSPIGSQRFYSNEKKKKGSHNKRDVQLAKAYGGKPKHEKPPQSKKKTKKNKMPYDGEEERPLTDRLFPSFLEQESKRVKNMAKVAYRQEENIVEGTQKLDFEDFFKTKMDEIQQFRNLAKEELANNQIIPSSLRKSGTEQQESRILRKNDSASTQKTPIKTNQWNDQPQQMSQGFDATASPIADPLQDLIGFDDKRGTSYNYQIKQLNQTTQSNQSYYKSNTVHAKSKTAYGNFKQQQPTKTYSAMSMNTTQPRIDDLSQNNQTQNDFEVNETQYDQYSKQQPANSFRKFDFYLPNKQARLKKNLEGREISFSSVGQMQLEGDSKIKGLERVYLQKYPGAQQQQQQPPQIQQRAANANQQNLLSAYASKNKKKGTLRNNTAMGGGQQLFSSGKNTQNMRLNNDMQQITNLGTVNNDEREENVTLFDGVANVLNKIERLRSKNIVTTERDNTIDNQRRVQNYSSSSTNAVGKLFTQNNNWV